MPKGSNFQQAKSFGGRFPTTSWTLIRKVQKGSEEDAMHAMEDVCRAYWYAIYAFARRRGFSPHDAEDLTQVFFQNLVTRETIQAAREEKGKLRTFMLAMLQQIISKHLRHEAAEKRGGNQAIVSFDEAFAEDLYSREPPGISDPGLIFDRAWAEGVLAAATVKLAAEYRKAENLETFEQIREFLPLGENVTPYAEAASRLGLKEATLRLQIHRMRKRYGTLIEEEIAQTVNDPLEQKDELSYLMAIMGQ
ncbi:MAG TPA: sigma factor [Prosthecobacter sp.]|nr:sigma factor [Prosthecobacter sp.]